MRRTLCLSIRGGGIRGIIAAAIGRAIEARMSRPFHETFSLVAGTSTGGIMACAIGAGKTLPEVIDLYIEHAGEIFSGKRSWPSRLLRSPKWPSRGLNRVLAQYLGDQTMRDSRVDLAVTAFSWEWQAFKVWNTFQDTEILLRDAASATARAPYYFAPHKIVLDRNNEQCYVDGGVGANDPIIVLWGLLHWLHATGRGDEWHPDRVKILQIGTGRNRPVGKCSDLTGGLLSTGPRIPGMMLDATAGIAEYFSRWVIGSDATRIMDVQLPDAHRAMDDGSRDNVAALYAVAGRWIVDNERLIVSVAEWLEES